MEQFFEGNTKIDIFRETIQLYMIKGRFILLLVTIAISLSAQQKKIILDADTGNEVDDLYAIVRALIEPSWDITALNADAIIADFYSTTLDYVKKL